jgi:hypothetical protein
MTVRIVEARKFEHVGGEEARVVVPEGDRIEISDEANNWQIVVQDDGHGRAEISVLEGRVTLYT